jgi:exodeoxyribonuclease VII small subunit
MGDETNAAATDAGSFEQILGRLSTVVETLEKGDLPLEQALASFEEGVRLSRLGAARLDEAERRVEELLSDDADVRTRALPAAASVDKEPRAR